MNKNVKIIFPKINFKKGEHTLPALRLVGFVIIFAGIGAYLLIASHADNFSNTTIVSKNSGQCLDVYMASKTAGANVQQWPCHNGSNQEWQIAATTNGYYKIINKNSGQCLDVYRASKTAGANVQQWPCFDSGYHPNQKWRLVPVGGGSYEIVSKNSGQCLDVYMASTAGGANVQQWPCHNGANQEWNLTPPATTPPPTAPTINFTASPSTVNSGSSSTLNWQSTNATSCTASGSWSGSQPVNGSVSTGALSANKTYVLTCSGNGGSLSQSVSVNVASSGGGGGGGSGSSSGTTVSASPLGPTAPAGGWTVEYADAFGSCLVQTNTSCSAGYARSDGGWAPLTSHNGAGNANEIASFQPIENDITKNGLSENCVAVANDGDNYSCGSLLGNGGPAGTSGNAPNAPNPFHWSPPSGHFVMQFQAMLPANQGNMDPQVWSNGVSDSTELDFPEWWGWNHIPTTSNSWCGDGWGFPAVPFDAGGSTGEADTFWCQSPGLNFDPSAAYHTYTMDINTSGSTTTMTGYIDGSRVTSQTYSHFNSEAEKLILGNDMRADNATGSRTAQTFPAGGNSLNIRYIAIYEASSNNNAGTNGPMIAPGTSVK